MAKTHVALLYLYALGCADGTNGAYEAAEVAADALLAHKARGAVVAEGDGLMTTITTADVAASAMYAFLTREEREDLCGSVKVRGAHEGAQL